jgi:hypothetical protein
VPSSHPPRSSWIRCNSAGRCAHVCTFTRCTTQFDLQGCSGVFMIVIYCCSCTDLACSFSKALSDTAQRSTLTNCVDYWRSAVECKSTTAQFGGLYAVVDLQSRRYDSMFPSLKVFLLFRAPGRADAGCRFCTFLLLPMVVWCSYGCLMPQCQRERAGSWNVCFRLR